LLHSTRTRRFVKCPRWLIAGKEIKGKKKKVFREKYFRLLEAAVGGGSKVEAQQGLDS
jgi:hypothetical protein